MQLVPKAIMCMSFYSRVGLGTHSPVGVTLLGVLHFLVSFGHDCKGQFINHTRFAHLFIYISSFMKINYLPYQVLFQMTFGYLKKTNLEEKKHVEEKPRKSK